jgi:hypothetical protein
MGFNFFNFWVFVFLFSIIFVLIIFFVIRKKWREKIDILTKKELLKDFMYIKRLTSSKEQIIDFDKLLHKILKIKWFEWNLWEILKQNPEIIYNIDHVWKLHKLRNKLVHDFDIVSEQILIKKVKEYEKIISEILEKI